MADVLHVVIGQADLQGVGDGPEYRQAKEHEAV